MSAQISPADYSQDRKEAAPLSDLPKPITHKESHSTIVEVAQLWASPRTVFSAAHLMGDVDPAKSTFPLAAYCFMTGFM